MATAAWPDYPKAAAIGNGPAADLPVNGANCYNPTPSSVGSRLRLDNGPQIRREIVKVYRQMKSGEVDVTKGTKLIYALDLLSRAIEREAVEKLSSRLDAVEQRR